METPSLYIAGHSGMVGNALKRKATNAGYEKIITATHKELDLTYQKNVFDFLQEHQPQTIIIAAAKVGGIYANNTYPAEFIYQNLTIASNLIHGAYLSKVPRVLFLGSSCIYPKFAPQPIPEDSLLTSTLEPTNEAYAIAKIAGLKLCQYYRKQYGVLYHSAMPTNLYGAGDNYHPENSHVIPGLIRRIHEAKEAGSAEVTIWGTGKPRREFLYVDDLADACFFLLKEKNPPDWINLGSGTDIPIIELAEKIATTVGFKGNISTNPEKPDGTPRKLMDNTRIQKLGWQPKVPLEEGLAQAYKDFLAQEKK